MRLKDKRVLVGVCGSIAAYKSALLVRLLVKEGAEVRVVMTDSAKAFIGPLTLSTLSKNPVYSSYFNKKTGEWTNHVELGLWPDLFIIAPCSANTVSKLANGNCDNLLQAIYLSARCETMIAPAMDLDMYKHKSFTRNLQVLKNDGVLIIEPTDGELASGLYGVGRMAEPESIFDRVLSYFEKQASLKGKRFLVNAGPTYEAIDPVRFIGNRSTGTMGCSIANELANRGADVILVLGPSNIKDLNPKIKLHRVESAHQMYEQCIKLYPSCDAVVLSAAVADFTVSEVAKNKIKKENADLSLNLVKTKDILAEIGKNKGDKFVVGFAMETENVLENAKSKLKNKNADLLVVNSLNDHGAGFGLTTNKIVIIARDGSSKNFELKDKKEVAIDVVNEIETKLIK